MLDASWVGRRVVIRHSLDKIEPGRPRLTDVVGDLVALSAETAVIEARAGRVDVALDRIIAAKVAEPSSADILALEAVAARGWRAEETAERDGWLLRANGGFTGRANSALPLQPGDATEAARAWYAEHGLPLRVMVPLPARRSLDDALAARGWAAAPDVQVLAARLDMLHHAGTAGVQIVDAPDPAWMACFRRGTAPQIAREILVRHDRAGFAEIRRDAQTIAIGRGTVDAGWLGVTAVEVVPQWRRHGLATAVMAALHGWASSVHGASRTYLQVAADNDAALALYRRMGYWYHHSYRYRTEH